MTNTFPIAAVFPWLALRWTAPQGTLTEEVMFRNSHDNNTNRNNKKRLLPYERGILLAHTTCHGHAIRTPLERHNP
ncbi:hypothetical protein GGR51DRAFT_477110 [Nemania sp. FL0031]|nr:hypothetical protein GGR51DRAFT_477110 [Nemania sp. FL0031]